MYRIEYSPEAEEHLRALTAAQRATVLNGVERHLTDRPLVATTNRKPMRPNPVAPWELRLGTLRVYFDAENEPVQVVRIRAVGIKRGNRVIIGGRTVEL